MEDRFRLRAWHKPTKKLFRVYSACPNFVFDEEVDGILASPTNPAKKKDCVLEQCTGLKDKNGRLIYEGDIVKATFKYMGSNAENLSFAVAFSDGAFGYFDELGRFGLLANFGTGTMLNVIGNIHENPELLGAEK